MFHNTSTDSHNEPSGPPATEPARYEFQSYLSDDDDEAALLRTAREPLPAEHYQTDLPTDNHSQSFDMDVDEQADTTLGQEQSQGQDGPVDLTTPDEAPPPASTHNSQADAMEVDSDTMVPTSPPIQETPPTPGSDFASPVDSSPDVVITRARKRARHVKIEVALPKISQRKKKTYEVIDLDSDDELSAVPTQKHYSPRRLRKRTQVSVFHICSNWPCHFLPQSAQPY